MPVFFNEDETERIQKNSENLGTGFRPSLFYLASSIHAAHAVRMRHKMQPAAYMVPVPQDERKRGATGPVFANHMTFLFYRVEHEKAGSISQTISSLKNQMTSQIREEIPKSYSEMMRIFRRLPLPLYYRLLSGPTKGQVASFFFSYTGDCCSGLDRFLGHRGRNLIHYAPVTYSPGLSVVFMRFCNRLCAILSYKKHCLSGTDLSLFRQTLRSRLLSDEFA